MRKAKTIPYFLIRMRQQYTFVGGRELHSEATGIYQVRINKTRHLGNGCTSSILTAIAGGL
jgi:hypothetical protein